MFHFNCPLRLCARFLVDLFLMLKLIPFSKTHLLIIVSEIVN